MDSCFLKLGTVKYTVKILMLYYDFYEKIGCSVSKITFFENLLTKHAFQSFKGGFPQTAVNLYTPVCCPHDGFRACNAI